MAKSPLKHLHHNLAKFEFRKSWCNQRLHKQDCVVLLAVSTLVVCLPSFLESIFIYISS